MWYIWIHWFEITDVSTYVTLECGSNTVISTSASSQSDDNMFGMYHDAFGIHVTANRIQHAKS